MTRIFHSQPLQAGQRVQLDEDAFNHAIRVLRMQLGDAITLFDGSNQIFTAQLVEIGKKQAWAKIQSASIDNRESPLAIHLGQVISRGDRMDFTIQKSVELGVTSITPLFSSRCGVKLSGERLAKKIQQWQKIVISACEQCGRNVVPPVNPAVELDDWLNSLPAGLKLNLHPRATQSIQTLQLHTPDITLLIGPEGGLDEAEIKAAHQAGFSDILLGPRVLRTETAALTAITALQVKFGDLS